MPNSLKLKPIPTESYDEPMIGKKYFPYFNLDSKQVPEVKDWEVGDEYVIVLKLKQTSKSENKDGFVNASFDVVAYKAVEDLSEVSDADLEKMQGDALSS